MIMGVSVITSNWNSVNGPTIIEQMTWQLLPTERCCPSPLHQQQTKGQENSQSAYSAPWEKHSPINLLMAVREQLSKCLEADQQTVDLIMPDNRANILKLWKMAIFHTSPSLIFCPDSQTYTIQVIENIKYRNYHCVSSKYKAK